MAANLRVATPVQVAVGREKPSENEQSGDDGRFSNLLSQRNERDETPPAQHVSAPKQKSSEPAKEKEDKPDDTLQLLQNSTSIQASVTPTTQTEQTQPTTAEAVDDVLAKSVAKPVSQPLISGLVTQGATGAAATPTTADASAPAAPTTDTSSQISQLLQQSGTTPEKPVVDSTAVKSPAIPATAVASDPKKASAPVQTNIPAPRPFEPTILTSTATADAPAPKATDAPQATSLPNTALPTTPVSTDNTQAVQLQATPQQPAVQAVQLDFSSASPIIVASAVAAAVTHHAMLNDKSADDSLDSIDTTSPSGALATFSVPEHHDIATVDGKVPVPAPSSPQFGDALGAKLSWMAERHIGHAEIRLSPDDLGTIDVRVRLNGEHVRAEFNSANADVRQAINTHLPRLRDMLSQHGFNLSESHVGNGSNQSSSQNAPDDHSVAPVDDDLALPAPRIPAYTHNGILDAFA